MRIITSRMREKQIERDRARESDTLTVQLREKQIRLRETSKHCAHGEAFNTTGEDSSHRVSHFHSTLRLPAAGSRLFHTVYLLEEAVRGCQRNSGSRGGRNASTVQPIHSVVFIRPPREYPVSAYYAPSIFLTHISTPSSQHSLLPRVVTLSLSRSLSTMLELRPHYKVLCSFQL